jgi:hypothetical protein
MCTCCERPSRCIREMLSATAAALPRPPIKGSVSIHSVQVGAELSPLSTKGSASMHRVLLLLGWSQLPVDGSSQSATAAELPQLPSKSSASMHRVQLLLGPHCFFKGSASCAPWLSFGQ